MSWLLIVFLSFQCVYVFSHEDPNTIGNAGMASDVGSKILSVGGNDMAVQMVLNVVQPSSSDLNQCKNSAEYKWIIKMEINNLLLLTNSQVLISNSLKEVYFNSIYQTLNMKWLDSFCFDLSDNQLKINAQYAIKAGFDYNNELQNNVFANETLFNQFTSVFHEELVYVFVENTIINNDTNNDTNNDIRITINTPEKYNRKSDAESDHKISASVIIIIDIIVLIDIVIFVAIVIYVFKNTKHRADMDGDASWQRVICSEKQKRYKLPYGHYIVACIEIIDSVIHWIFAIIVITYPSWLGWILFCLLITADIILYMRYMLYKQFILYQIPKIASKLHDIDDDINSQRKLHAEIVTRRIDIALFGIALTTMQDIPVISIVIIVAQNFGGYDTIKIMSLMIAIISICMKIVLLINARFASISIKEQEIIMINASNARDDINTLMDEENAKRKAIQL